MARSRDRGEWVANFQRRVIQDALQSGAVSYWRRRAAAFAAVGNDECDGIARACSNLAAYIEKYGLDQDELLRDLWSVAVFGVTADELEEAA